MKKHIDNREGERMSFFKLFAEKDYKLVIPIIQREYAQGRKSENINEVRNEFLDALYGYLDANIPYRDLDFVYGNIMPCEDETQFIPLDGQQRLTTLFLLHWYLYNISENEDAKELFIKRMICNGRSRFSYETRMSATNFCDSLMSHTIDMGHLYQNEEDNLPSLSATIKNKNWYYRTWDYDPTVQSMLVMLDSIHEKFNERPEFFERQTNTEEPIITFLFMDLQKYQLTDDLYIKMNSRGKQLTSFENFKAKYEQYLKTVGQEETFTLSFGNAEKEVDLSRYFSYNIDTKWTNLFWNYRHLRLRHNDFEHFDDLIANFIRVVFANTYAGKVYIRSNSKNETLEKLIQDSDEHLSFNTYQKLDALSEESALYLVRALDALSANSDGLACYLPEEYKFYYNEENMFRKVMENNLSYADRLQFHAYLQFLIRYEDKSGLADWMRVIKNITDMENSATNTIAEFSSKIRSINELLKDADHILEHMSQIYHLEGFNLSQIKEENAKANLILSHDGWRKEIEEIEKHGYFNGRIGFLLDYAEVYLCEDYDWDETTNEELLNTFRNYKKKAGVVFANSYDDRINDTNYCLERAAMTKGNYFVDTSGKAFNMLTTNVVKNNVKRDYSWKRVLHPSECQWGYDIFKEILDDERFDVNDVVGSLETIAKDGCKDCKWKDLLIKNPDLIEYSTQGFIGTYEDNGIMLLTSKKSNATHAELYSYYLYTKFIANKIDSECFWIEYIESKDYDFIPRIFFGTKHQKKMYELRIYGLSDEDNNYEFESYQFHFLKSSGRKHYNDYSDDIINIMKKNGLEWTQEVDGKTMKQENWGFYYDAKSETEAIGLIKTLCKAFEAL